MSKVVKNVERYVPSAWRANIRTACIVNFVGYSCGSTELEATRSSAKELFSYKTATFC